MKYKVKFWDDKIVEIEVESLDNLIEYLYTNESKRIYEIMKCNSELSLWQNGDSTLLWHNQFSGSFWFVLDTGKLLDHRVRAPFDNRHKCLLPEITIDKLNFDQFRNLIILMWANLADEYGGTYMDFFQEVNGQYVDVDYTPYANKF